MSELIRTALAIDKGLFERFDAWMARHGYSNRSEAVRDLIRAALVEQDWQDPDATVMATLSILYDHHRHELAQRLTDLQHEDHHCILCSQHVHLDHENCLEVIILKGPPQRPARPGQHDPGHQGGQDRAADADEPQCVSRGGECRWAKDVETVARSQDQGTRKDSRVNLGTGCLDGWRGEPLRRIATAKGGSCLALCV